MVVIKHVTKNGSKELLDKINNTTVANQLLNFPFNN